MGIRVQLPQHRHGVTVDPADEGANIRRQDRRQHVVPSVGQVNRRRATLRFDVAVGVGFDEVTDVGDED